MIRIANVFQVVILTLIGLSSCAIVTVNVYFPAEEVQEAYKSLEEELLRPQPPQGETPGAAQPPEGQPQSLIEYPEKPQIKSRKLIALKRKFSIEIAAPAWAQDNLSKQITNEIRKMPDVLAAFRSRGGRLGVINNMLTQGKVGEGNEGLLVERGALTGDEGQALNAENSDRRTIIRGMARTIVKINQLEETDENISRLLPQAGEQFAEVRRDEAKPGSEVQLSNGEWIKK